MNSDLKKIHKRLDAIECTSTRAKAFYIQEYFDYFDCMVAWHTAALAAFHCGSDEC